VRWILNDVDVDIATFEWINARASVDRVFVLDNLDDGIQLTWSVAVAAHVIKVDKVGLAALPGHDSNSTDCTTGELTRKELQRGGTQVLVSTVQLLFLPWHEEVDDT
jgi:hypothetical protein